MSAVISDTSAAVEQLRALFLEHFHVEVPSADADLLESGVLDSLQLVELLLLIEQRFGRRIHIESIDLDDLRSLKRLAQLVAEPGAAQSNVREVASRRGAGHRG